VRGAHRGYAERHPRGDESVLVVEVSRTTQDVDRDKATVYARAAVPAYWLLDIAARRIEVYSRAASDRHTLMPVLAENDETDVPETSGRWIVRELLPP
jgi:Uma2 family endonuclease